MKTKIINLEDVETTVNPLFAAETGEVLMFTTVNSFEDRALSIQYVEYGEIGYERKSDWMRLVNKLNDYDTTPVLRMITGDKKSSDWGAMIISREDIDYSEDGFLIKFKEPVQLLIETIGEQAIVAEVTKLKGKYTWEWLHRKGHEDLGNYAGVCEIYMYDVQIVE